MAIDGVLKEGFVTTSVDALINWRFSMRLTRVLARQSMAVTPNVAVTPEGKAFAFVFHDHEKDVDAQDVLEVVALDPRVTAQRLACGGEFIQLSGNDDMALGFIAMGGRGCIRCCGHGASA